MTTLIMLNEGMEDSAQYFLEDSGLLVKYFTKTIKNETKEQRGQFPSMLLGTLGSSLLGNVSRTKIN